MVKVIVGTMGRSPFYLTQRLSTPQHYREFLACCKKYSIKELDSARIYGGGELEAIMSESLKDFHFDISTKIGILPNGGSLKHENIVQSAEKSLSDLNVASVDIFYIHKPDRQVPLEETCSAINEVYKQGRFKRFEICGYSAEETQTIYDICKSNGFILPTVYQGNFNPVTRNVEFDLFPTLRRLGMAFYAFSPLASDLLIKAVEELLNADTNSRFGALPFIGGLYLKEPVTSQVKLFQQTCKSQDIPPLDATLRYLLHHSALRDEDGIIIGASSSKQLETNLKATKGGPLPPKMVQAFEDLWIGVRDEAPPYYQ